MKVGDFVWVTSIPGIAVSICEIAEITSVEEKHSQVEIPNFRAKMITTSGIKTNGGSWCFNPYCYLPLSIDLERIINL
jgi:hypothetical protein